MPPTIAKLLVTIKTAKMKNIVSCEVPRAELSINILKVFRKYNLIYGVQVNSEKILTFLRYFRGRAVFNTLNLATKPTKPIYINKKKLTKLLQRNTALIFIFSTPKGIVGLDNPAKPKNLNTHAIGELLCFGW